MVTVSVNGKEVEVAKEATVLQACESAGAEIPRFCYHERLSIAGNCRMCLVEIEGGPPKPAASCAMPVQDGMKIRTDSPMVKKAREGVMEFLLINHPLDCPICDQGGECDLQDQAMAYGSGLSRYVEHKRAVKEKSLGPLVKTHMTRCIHCTRCIRFATEVAGVEEIGATSRGESMEVGTYVEKTLSSELSGNIIDLCPVGALTSKPYAFNARPWELKKTESIDILDAVGSNIRVDSRGREVMRILPRLNEAINEEWISDKTRFAYDGLKLQRLDRPFIRKKKLAEATWEEAMVAAIDLIRSVPPMQMAILAGDLIDCESIQVAKDVFDQLSCPHMDCRQDSAYVDVSNPASYVFNTTIAGIDQADLCIIIGSNPRIEAPIINARIGKNVRNGSLSVSLIGPELDLTYPYASLGKDIAVIDELINGSHPLSSQLKKAKKPMIIVGQDTLTRSDAEVILAKLSTLSEQSNIIQSHWNGFNILHKAAARVGGLDLGFIPQGKGYNTKEIVKRATANNGVKLIVSLGADEVDLSKRHKDCKVIYLGHHGDVGAQTADIIFPTAAYTEKSGSYMNTEGRLQRTNAVVPAPGKARPEWHILLEMAHNLSLTLPYEDITGIRQHMHNNVTTMKQLGITKRQWQSMHSKKTTLNKTPIALSATPFYQTDVISRSSKTMAACQQVANIKRGEQS